MSKRRRRRTKPRAGARRAARPAAEQTPGQLKSETIKTLLAAHRFTLSAEYRATMKDKPAAAKNKAAKVSLGLLWAAQDLQAAKVREIREKLEANEQNLKDGVKNLKSQLKRLQNIAKFLDIAGKVISVVGRIVAL